MRDIVKHDEFSRQVSSRNSRYCIGEDNGSCLWGFTNRWRL